MAAEITGENDSNRQVTEYRKFSDWLTNVQSKSAEPIQLDVQVGNSFELRPSRGFIQGSVELVYEVPIGNVSHRISQRYNYSKMPLEGPIGRVECATTASQLAITVDKALKNTGGVDLVTIHLANGMTRVFDHDAITYFASRRPTPFHLRRVVE